jgi:hypothetical protein
MPLPRSKVLFALFVVAVAATTFTAGFGPYVRRRVASEGARLHCAIDVAGVRPAWFGVRLLGVQVHAHGVDGATLALDEVRVDASWSGHPTRVRATGGAIELHGTQSELSRELAEWRASLVRGANEDHARLPIHVEGVGVRWPDVQTRAAGVWADRDARGVLTAGAVDVEIERDDETARVRGVRIELASDRTLESVAADAVAIVYGNSPTSGSGPGAAPHSESLSLAVARGRARNAARRLAEHFPEYALASVAAFSIEPRADERGLSFGPGALSIARDERSVTIDFSSSPGVHGTRFDGRAVIPLDDGELRADVRGGPVTLAALGLRNGQAGLSDLESATIEGRAAIVATDASATVDVDLHAAGLGFFNRRVATHTLHDLALSLRAKGEIDADGNVRIDDADAGMGAAHLTTHGTLNVARGNESIALDLAVAETPCQDLLDSAPAALLPTVHGMTMSGAFSASARVSVAFRAVDRMKLSYDVRDGCHVTSVPEAIDHERFLHPFTHRVYSPRGDIRDATTGPGTAAWTPLAAMSRYLPVAVLMTEDGGVFRRKGFNEAQIQYAVRTDLRERRFARGASTMTMQLAKNLFLTRDKVLARKLEEVILTKYLSERFTENEILELYLNVIEFGPDIYGVAEASRTFYGKSAAALTLAESLYMAAILPSPVKFYAMKQSGNVPPYWMASIQHLMELAHTSHLISDEELEEGKGETIAFR